MKIFSELKKLAKLLQKYPGQWAICGGVAASIYRASPRFTDDIDIAVIDSEKISALDLSRTVLEQLGYQLYNGFIVDPIEGEKQIKALICGRCSADERYIGIDFLLPIQFWIEPAVLVAQENKIDFGFASLPTITPESLIFAKLVALNSNDERYKDLDDIKEILKSEQLNLEIIRIQIKQSKVKFKSKLISLIPGAES